MREADTWNNILRSLIAVRDAHGWTEVQPQPVPSRVAPRKVVEELSGKRPAPPRKRKPTARKIQRKPSVRRRPKLNRRTAKTKSRKATKIATRGKALRSKRVTAKKRRAGKRR
jgi:hypothetical protein